MLPPSSAYTLRHRGTLHFPGVTNITKKVAEEILHFDADEHHCFYRAPSIHNHLSHHLLAAFDLGGSPSLLKAIEKRREPMQRPIELDPKDKDIIITDVNWFQFVGNANAYYGYYTFFTASIESSGVLDTLERYIFSEKANTGDAQMIIRLMSGALHPFIQIGYGVEFGHHQLIAAGIAMAAVTTAFPSSLFVFENPQNSASPTAGTPARQCSQGPSLLELLKQIYDSPELEPVMPYNRELTIYDHLRNFMKSGRPQALRKVISQYHVDESGGDEEFNSKIEEYFWVSVLITFASGKVGRKPRLDFYLMHLVTSAIFFPSLFTLLKNPNHKANILRAFLSNIALLTILRGRPVIKPDLLMSYTASPRPPIYLHLDPYKTSLGNPSKDEDYNPWPELVTSSLPYPDAHINKVVRSLVYAAQEYGHVAPGEAIGAFVLGSPDSKPVETHPGTSKMDGTIFVRAAGMMMDYLGWVTYGQVPLTDYRDWDRSGLGWEDAWKDEESTPAHESSSSVSEHGRSCGWNGFVCCQIT